MGKLSSARTRPDPQEMLRPTSQTALRWSHLRADFTTASVLCGYDIADIIYSIRCTRKQTVKPRFDLSRYTHVESQLAHLLCRCGSDPVHPGRNGLNRLQKYGGFAKRPAKTKLSAFQADLLIHMSIAAMDLKAHPLKPSGCSACRRGCAGAALTAR
jgi:hypothetical protein